MKRLRVIGMLFGGAVALAVAGLAWIIVVRPGMDAYRAHAAASGAAVPDAVTATWFGTTAVLLRDDKHAVFVDPFFTRPAGAISLLRNAAIAPDEAVIRQWLGKAGVTRLDAVLVSHSHYDHAMDAAVVARLTGATLVGSQSTANIGRGGGLPETQIRVVEPGEPVALGSFSATFVGSRHAGATGGRPTGEIEQPLKPPARYLDYRQGATYSILVGHAQGTVLHHGSAGFVAGALAGRTADVVLLGIALREDLEAYLREVVDSVGARVVLPVHWDDFTRPLGEPLRPSPVGVNLDEFFEDMVRLRPDVEVRTFELGQPVTLFTRKDSAGGSPMDSIARAYVDLVLAVGEHDSGYVDAYYGPTGWRDAVNQKPRALPAIEGQAQELVRRLQAEAPPAGDELLRQRHDYLRQQLGALVAHVQRLQGRKFTFDDEARALYDVTPPVYAEAQFQPTLDRLERLLPGDGPLADRYNAFVERFAIPREKIEAVMGAAIAEARTRTKARLALPDGETFELRLVNDKPWSAYNWYKGNYHSLIEVNTDLPVTAGRIIDLAVHEGYPGHHVYNSLLEKHLVRDRGWPEFQVYPLYSPQSLIAEGTADFGIDVAFPEAERVAFLRDVIFPAAGLDPAQAQLYDDVTRAADGLGGVAIEAARRYRDGTFGKDEAVAFMRRFGLASEARAKQRIAFFDALGAYIVNYSLGEELVHAYVERHGGTAQNPDRRWKIFGALISSPQLPSALAAPAP